MSRNWNAGGGFRKPLFRYFSDLFDDTKHINYGRKLSTQINKTYKPTIPKEIGYTRAIQIEDYFSNDVDIRIPVPTITTYKKEILIAIPKIKLKWDISTLKKIALVCFIFVLPIFIISIVVIGYRIVYITNGDWTNELVKYRIDEKINEKLNPVVSTVQYMKQDVEFMKANQVPVVVYHSKIRKREWDYVAGKKTIVKETIEGDKQ